MNTIKKLISCSIEVALPLYKSILFVRITKSVYFFWIELGNRSFVKKKSASEVYFAIGYHKYKILLTK